MARIGDQYAAIILNILYGNNHFGPTNKCNNVIDVPIIFKHDVCNNIAENINLSIKGKNKNEFLIKNKKAHLEIWIKWYTIKNEISISHMESTRKYIKIHLLISTFGFIHIAN